MHASLGLNELNIAMFEQWTSWNGQKQEGRNKIQKVESGELLQYIYKAQM